MGKGTTETTSSVKWPEYVEEGQKKVVKGALEGMTPFLDDPTINIADLRPEYATMLTAANDALGAHGSNAGAAQSVIDRSTGANYGKQLQGLEKYAQGANFSGAASGLLGLNSGVNYAPQMAGMVGAGERTIPVASSYAQTDANEALALGNPFAEHMAEQVVGKIDDAHEKNANSIAAQAARRSAFGGSSEAIARAQNDMSRGDQTKDALTGILNDSYTVGSNLASQNMNSRNQALGRTVNSMLASTGIDMDAIRGAESLMGSYNNRNQSNIGLLDNLASNYISRNTGVAGAQDGLEGNYQNRTLQAIGAKDQMDNAAISRLAQELGLLGGVTDKFQSHDQQLEDQDLKAFGILSGLIPGVQGTQVNTEPANNSGLIGLGAALLGGI